MKPSLIVHGGAWDIPDEAIEACKSGCERALAAGWSILSRGGSALDAIEAAIMVLEDDPLFDAGYGSHLNLDGRVECDAIVMNGATLRAGAASTLQRVKNPILAARKILENCPHMMLVAEGAERFAKEHGIALCNPEDLISEAEREAWTKCKADKHAAEHHRGHEQGTVGAVAIDRAGNLFAATHRRHLLQISRARRRFAANRMRMLRRFRSRWSFLYWLRRSHHENRYGQDYCGFSAPARDLRECTWRIFLQRFDRGDRRPRSSSSARQTNALHWRLDSFGSRRESRFRFQYSAHGLRLRCA
jgi:hypothetical protein